MGYDNSTHLHILNAFSKLYFVTDLEQSLSYANMPQHTSGGYKLGEKEKRKQGF